MQLCATLVFQNEASHAVLHDAGHLRESQGGGSSSSRQAATVTGLAQRVALPGWAAVFRTARRRPHVRKSKEDHSTQASRGPHIHVQGDVAVAFSIGRRRLLRGHGLHGAEAGQRWHMRKRHPAQALPACTRACQARLGAVCRQACKRSAAGGTGWPQTLGSGRGGRGRWGCASPLPCSSRASAWLGPAGAAVRPIWQAGRQGGCPSLRVLSTLQRVQGSRHWPCTQQRTHCCPWPSARRTCFILECSSK